MSHDIARIGTDLRKRYTGTGMQQGRPITEDDWNENRRLTAEESRRALLDMIGPSGTPDSGFLIDDPRFASGALDVRIGAGTIYLGGERLEMLQPERYIEQSDWLEHVPADDGVAPPVAGNTLTTLAYLETWQQTVTATEDRELFEPALGGPDTSTRQRMMRRVHLADAKAAATCTAAWAALTAAWKKDRLGTVGASGERVVDTTLTVTPVPGTPAGDLCSPPTGGGYLGAENQAIRVQLVDKAHFTWGYDNASPLYRVTLDTDKSGKATIVKFGTTPKDQAHWPLLGMVVELLAWSAVLPSNEKIAETTGMLTRVAASYDPVAKTISIADDAAAFGMAWTARGDAMQLATLLSPAFFYLRVWDRGTDVTSATKIPFSAGVPVTLGTNGLAVTFGGADAAPGDSWVIAARPATPQLVFPWQLLGGAHPHGIRRFYTPLAMVAWTAGGGTVVDDCRQKFAPLTRLRGCCTVTVGDGVTSFGDVTSVQAGVDALPPAGGEVCVRPGVYREFVSISGKNNVVIEGCGERSLLLPPAGDVSTRPVIEIDDSTHVTIRSLAVRATTGPGIAWNDFRISPALTDIALRELTVEARDMSAIAGHNGTRVTVERCTIGVTALAAATKNASGPGAMPAVFLSGDDLLVERNTIRYLGPARGFAHMPLGGLQIGGGSTGVDIRRNLISGGMGNGITLGSISFTTRKELLVYYGAGSISRGERLGSYAPHDYTLDTGGCIHIIPPGGGVPPVPGKPQPYSDGDVSRVRIIDNTIEEMGSNGIASVRFYDLQLAFIVARELVIESNVIRTNVLLPRATTGAPVRARGGIALASAELATIRSNTISGNGTTVNEPMCGIYLQHGSDLDITLNRIQANGKRTDLVLRSVPGVVQGGTGSTFPLLPGTVGGGIVIDLAIGALTSALARSIPYEYMAGNTVDAAGRSTNGVRFNNDVLRAFTASSGVAARIEENEVVAPNGRALELVAGGEVSVHGNSFAAFSTHDADYLEAIAGGGTGRPLDRLGGAVVAVLNLGISHEAMPEFINLAGMSRFASLDTAVLGAQPRPDRLDGGDILFHDNQCELNLLESRYASPFTSVLLISADDVSMQNNQCNVVTPPSPAGQDVAFDIVYVHALALGVSVRMTGNRMKEGRFTLLSGTSIGWFNTTAHNQGTHCFLALAPAARLLVARDNTSLAEMGPTFSCESYVRQIGQFMSLFLQQVVTP